MSNGNKKLENAITFSQLCDDTYNDLKNYILRYTSGDEHLTDEIIQETFLYASDNKEKVLSHPNPKAWLYKTAKIFYFRYRDKNKTLTTNEESFNKYVENENDTLIEKHSYNLWYNNFQDESIIDEIFSNISEKEKELILLHHVDGLSLKEIADKWGENYSKLQKSNYRLMQKISELMKKRMK